MSIMLIFGVVMGRRKKYGRDYPNNPKVDPMFKRIPFNRSISRGVILAFEERCVVLGVDKNAMVEELLKNFIKETKDA